MTTLWATATTEQAYQEGYNFKHCTNCGILPAVVQKDPDLEEREALCYYCYLRRKLHRFAEKLIGKKIQIVPSTIDIANLNNWRKILKKDPSEYGFIMEEEDYGSLPEALKVEDDKAHRQFFYTYTITKRLMLELDEPKDDVEKKVKEDIRKVNIYYAIVKADGDYVGKKLLRGDLGIKLGDYVSKTVMEGYATDISYLPDDKVPTTPDYYFVFSKSLMAVALKDMLDVQKEGFIIYAGGDDLAFLSPIVDDKEDLVVIELVRKTRRNYWGVSNGFNFVGNIPIDAPAVYGRSYAVILTHYKEPFFYSWSIATDIEEEKDNYEGKDVTFILRFRGSYDEEDVASLRSWGEDLETVMKLYECIMKKKALSKSFIRDVMETFDKYDVSETLYPAYINYLIKRNSEKDCEGVGALKVPGKLGKKFKGVEVVKALKHLIPSQGE